MASIRYVRTFLKAPAINIRSTAATSSFFHSSAINMGVTKTTHQEGSGPSPNKGDRVTIEYTGFLKDTSKSDNKGNKYV